MLLYGISHLSTAERLKAENPLNAGRAVLRQPSKNKYPFTAKTIRSRKSTVETFAALTKRREAKIGTDGLLTSVPFFVVGHLSRHPLSSRNALIRDLVLALMSSILNQERRTWTRSVGTKNCSSPALPRTGPRSWTKVEGRLSARSCERRTMLLECK